MRISDWSSDVCSSDLADWRSWNDVAGRLPSGVYAITMDLRGHGTSSPSAGDYSLVELAADVLNVMDNLAFARVHLVGTSGGSVVAQYFGATPGTRLIRSEECCVGHEFFRMG